MLICLLIVFYFLPILIFSTFRPIIYYRQQLWLLHLSIMHCNQINFLSSFLNLINFSSCKYLLSSSTKSSLFVCDSFLWSSSTNSVIVFSFSLIWFTMSFFWFLFLIFFSFLRIRIASDDLLFNERSFELLWCDSSCIISLTHSAFMEVLDYSYSKFWRTCLI